MSNYSSVTVLHSIFPKKDVGRWMLWGGRSGLCIDATHDQVCLRFTHPRTREIHTQWVGRAGQLYYIGGPQRVTEAKELGTGGYFQPVESMANENLESLLRPWRNGATIFCMVDGRPALFTVIDIERVTIATGFGKDHEEWTWKAIQYVAADFGIEKGN